MANLVKYSCLFILLILPTFSNGQMVDGFDYPFGDRGIKDGQKRPYPEKIGIGEYKEEVNLLYPFNPYPNPERWDNTNKSGWYNYQDVGSFYSLMGGLHPGEDWNFSSENENEIGQAVYSVANGIILSITYTNGRNVNDGYKILVKHYFDQNKQNYCYSLYLHITSTNCLNGELYENYKDKFILFRDNGQKILIIPGETIVQKGDMIGRIASLKIYSYIDKKGNLQTTKTPDHLHFEIRINKNLDNLKLWPNGNKNAYYSDNKTIKSSLNTKEVTEAFTNMYLDGIVDPSDFIDNHRNSIGVGYYSENDWRNDGVSLAFLNCYNKNGGNDTVGDPFDNGGGPFIHPFSIEQDRIVYFQDFKNDNDKLSTICYNPRSGKAFYLKGCIWFLWWQKASNSKPYYEFLGLPINDEEKSSDGNFTIMQKFENGIIYWRKECLGDNENLKIEITNFQEGNGCLVCNPKNEYFDCSCELKSTRIAKSLSSFQDCDQLFSAPYLQKTSWDFGNEETFGWTARNANDLGYGDGWYWMVDPVKDPDQISGSGIVSPPFLSSINTDSYNQMEIRMACKSQFLKTVQLHLLIAGEWKPPLILNCISPSENQLPNYQCVYRGNILYPGQIQQFRIDFIEGSDIVDDKLFIDYIKFIAGSSPVPKLEASFSSDVQFGMFPFSIKFTNSSQTKNVSSTLNYEWNFGDGTTSKEQSPTHIYTKPGEYTVSLKVSSDIYNNSIVHPSYIKVFESSPVSNLEYFFDIDPGHGKGIPVVVSPSEDLSQSFDIYYNNLSEGYHTLFIRAKDGSGKWGTEASKPFYAVHIDDIPYVAQIEYFLDKDPGAGKGIPVISGYDTFEEQNLIIENSQLTDGYHTLFVRAKDSFENWSLVATKEFYSLHANDVQNINQMEYFFNYDPGYGNGKPITVSKNTVEEQNVILDFSELAEGYHTLFVRTKDNFSRWGTIASKPFYRITASNQDNITHIEYYIDSDPGIGKATNEKINPTMLLQHTIFLDMNSLQQGNHKIGFRVKNGHLNWGDTKVQNFTFKSAPVANAGSDQSVNKGSTISLDGSASSDSDGDPLTYNWTAPAGITLSSTNVANPTFIAPEVTTNTSYTFLLVVNDGTVDSPVDQVVITVRNVNKAPVANAGVDQSVNERVTFTLDGSLSSDPDNNTITYLWTVPVGITLSSNTVAKPTFTAPEVTSDTPYSFLLVVNDGTLNSVADQVIITVKQIDKDPYVKDSIDNVSVDKRAPDQIIDLKTVFADDDLGDVLIYTITSNTNDQVVTAKISGANLIISFSTTNIGLSEIVITANSNGKEVNSKFKAEVKIPTGIDPIISDQKLIVYPNPTSGKVNIVFEQLPESGTYLIVSDVTGKTILKQLIQNSKELIDLKGHTPGIYLIKTNLSNLKVQKVILK